MSNISTRIKLRRTDAATVTGTSAVNSTGVDTAGFDGVLLFTTIGTAASNNTVHAAQGDDNSSFADLEGTSVVATGNGEVVWLDIYKPTDRYVRLEITRGTSTTVGEIYAILYEGSKLPIDNLVDDTIIGELHISPDEGTA